VAVPQKPDQGRPTTKGVSQAPVEFESPFVCVGGGWLLGGVGLWLFYLDQAEVGRSGATYYDGCVPGAPVKVEACWRTVVP
jgi:hypothetical protein